MAEFEWQTWTRHNIVSRTDAQRSDKIFRSSETVKNIYRKIIELLVPIMIKHQYTSNPKKYLLVDRCIARNTIFFGTEVVYLVRNYSPICPKGTAGTVMKLELLGQMVRELWMYSSVQQGRNSSLQTSVGFHFVRRKETVSTYKRELLRNLRDVSSTRIFEARKKC